MEAVKRGDKETAQKMVKGKTLGMIEKNGNGRSFRDSVKNFFGFVDTSKGYSAADLENDRPYLKKSNQATSGALFIPGNAGGSRLDARSVTAVLKSLEKTHKVYRIQPQKSRA